MAAGVILVAGALVRSLLLLLIYWLFICEKKLNSAELDVAAFRCILWCGINPINLSGARQIPTTASSLTVSNHLRPTHSKSLSRHEVPHNNCWIDVSM